MIIAVVWNDKKWEITRSIITNHLTNKFVLMISIKDNESDFVVFSFQFCA